MSKIHCTNPSHIDETPSMEIYSDGAYCYSCGWVDRLKGDVNAKKVPPDNIQDKISYINDLPRKTVRGLSLPYDDQGYYIVWPYGGYYKHRLFFGSVRYLGPRGHRAPLFQIPGSKDSLVVVEGELNALSLQASEATISTVVSPGSANEILRHLEFYLTFPVVHAILDKDIAGVINGLKLKTEMLKRGKHFTLSALETDFNETLEKEGPEAVKIQFKDLGLQ